MPTIIRTIMDVQAPSSVEGEKKTVAQAMIDLSERRQR